MKIRIEGLPAAELVAALYGLVRRRRKADFPISPPCEAWLGTGPLQDHPAVAMTLALHALGFELRSAVQFVLHHGAMPGFPQIDSYPEQVLRQVPVKRMAELFDLPASPEAVLHAYADTLRHYWQLCHFDAVLADHEAEGRRAAAQLSAMLPDAAEVEALSFLLQADDLPDLWVIPLLFAIFEERSGMALASGELCLATGAPPPQLDKGRGRFALVMGVRYHLLATALRPHLAAQRATIARSEGLLALLADKGLQPEERDWFRLVMRYIVYGLSYWVEVQRAAAEWERVTIRYTAGGPLHLLPWFYQQIKDYLRAERAPSLGRLAEILVVRLAADQEQIRVALAHRPFPECLRAAFSPYWHQRETWLVLPSADREEGRLLAVAGREWRRRLPVRYDDQLTMLPDGVNLVLYGSPASNAIVGRILDEVCSHRAVAAGLSLDEALSSGGQLITACAHPTTPEAFLYLHIAGEDSAIQPMPGVSASDIGWVVFRPDGTLGRGHWPV